MAFAHEFGENVRGRALFAVHAHEKWENVREVAFLGKMAHEFGENVRERRLKGRVKSKKGGFVVGRGGERDGRDDFYGESFGY